MLSLCISSSLQIGDIITLANGDKAITGRGCGASYPLKFLDEMPEDPKQFPCSIITKEKNIINKYSAMIQGKYPFIAYLINIILIIDIIQIAKLLVVQAQTCLAFSPSNLMARLITIAFGAK